MKTILRFTILAAVLVLFVATFAGHRESELMRTAVMVATSPRGYSLHGEHHWLSSNELLAVVNSNEMVEEGEYYGFPYRVMRIRSGSSAHSFLRLPKKLERDGCLWTFSPDGSMLLCETMDRDIKNANNHSSSYYLSSLDGQTKRVHSEVSDGIPCSPMAWLGDGSSWVDISKWDGVVRVRSLAGPTIIKRIPEYVFNSDLLITESPTRQLVGHIGSKAVDSITCGTWNPDTGRSSQRTIPTPVRGEVISVAVSPNGKKLGWIIWVRDRSWVRSQIRRLPMFKSMEPIADSFQLWITDLYGSGGKRVGTKKIKAWWDSTPSCFAPGWRTDGGFNDLQWLPDSRSVSFTLDDSIYVVKI